MSGALGDWTRHRQLPRPGGGQPRRDEPTGNLDEETRDDVVNLLESMSRFRDLTLVIVTHDSAVARRAPRIALIRNGRLSIRQRERSESLA